MTLVFMCFIQTKEELQAEGVPDFLIPHKVVQFCHLQKIFTINFATIIIGDTLDWHSNDKR